MSFFRRLFRLDAEQASPPAPDADFWYEGSQRFSRSDAVAVPVVLACVRVLAEGLASMPLQVFKRDGEDREIAREHPLYRRLHDSPNPYYTAFEFWEMVMWSLLLEGNFLAAQHLTARNDLDWLEPLDWCRVQVGTDRQTGIRVFSYSPKDGGPARKFVDSEVLYIPGPGYDGEKSRSLIDINGPLLGISREAQSYVLHYFRNNGIPPAYVTFPGNLGEKQLSNWAAWFKKNFGGSRNSGKLGIFDNGGKIETVNLDHQKMQLSELRSFQVAEWCRVFRVPPHLVQDLTRSTNNNIEHQSLDFWIQSMRSWACRVEGRINTSLLGEREGRQYFAEFNMDSLLRGDEEARATAQAARITNGLMTPNEGRKMENRKALPGGDSLYMQGAMVRIEDIPSMSEAQQEKEQVVAK